MKKSELNPIIRVINSIEEWVLAFCIATMAIILIGNVLNRTILGSSWYFAEEVGQALVVAVTFLGLGYATRHQKHVNMSMTLDLMKEKHSSFAKMIICLITALASLFLAYNALRYTVRVYELERVTPALRMPYYIVNSFVSIGYFLCAIESFYQFYCRVTNKPLFNPELQ